MPKVIPGAHLAFTNHWIGVYRGVGNLRPIARQRSPN
jgi:hypothetical protein